MALKDANKKGFNIFRTPGEALFDVTHKKKKKRKRKKDAPKAGLSRAFANDPQALDEALEGRALARRKKARKRVGFKNGT